MSLTPEQIEGFVEQFNSCFGSEWLPENLASARVAVTGGICITIGNRDIQFDENLNFIGRGTDMTVDRYGTSRGAVDSLPQALTPIDPPPTPVRD